MQFDAQNESVASPLVAAANDVIDSMKLGKDAPLDTMIGLFFPEYIRDWTAQFLKRTPGTLANVGYVGRQLLMDTAQQTAHERRTSGSTERDFLTYLARHVAPFSFHMGSLCLIGLLYILPLKGPRACEKPPRRCSGDSVSA